MFLGPDVTFTNYPNKDSLDALIDPTEFLEYLKSQGNAPSFTPPHGAIICYQGSLWKRLCELPKTRAGDGFLTSSLLLEERDKTILSTKCQGVGAPIAVTQLEEIIAFGVRRFVTIGTAGTLQRDIAVGNIILSDRAIRDEGTSHHYLENRRFVKASPLICVGLKSALEARGLSFRVGTSWTTDAPYHETIEVIV